MAVLLGAFFLQGIMPGPDMLDKHLVLTFSMVWTMVVANIITVAVSLFILNYLAKLTLIRGTVLIPFILFFAFIGAYTSNNHLGDLFVFLAFGFLGYLMISCGWPRAPLVLGFVLGRIAENNFYISTIRYGPSWTLRPLVLVLIALSVIVLFFPFMRFKRRPLAGETSNEASLESSLCSQFSDCMCCRVCSLRIMELAVPNRALPKGYRASHSFPRLD